MTEGITPLAAVMVLVSAVLHAGWNIVAKKSRDQLAFLYLMTFLLPGLLIMPAAMAIAAGAGWPPVASILAALATSVLWIIYYEALARALARGDVSVAYPVLRGVAPVGAAFLGLALGEHITAWGGLGIVAIGLAVMLIGADPRAGRRPSRAELSPAIWAGIASAVYSVVDKQGVRGCAPVVYFFMCVSFLGVWQALRIALRREWPAMLAQWREEWRIIAPSAVANCAAYQLVLTALQQANASYVVPLRAASVLISVVAGGLALGEASLGWRLWWGTVIVGGIALIALAG